uniref:CSON005157 protein n=1 Tax=Culicoides sonorensis TaxID=179676 RepID=A0A336MWE7_CULSO
MDAEINGNHDEVDDVVELYTDFIIAYNSFRYSVPFNIGSVPKSQDFLLEIVPQLDDERFKMLFRMSRSTFGKLLNLIENDECFEYKGRGRKQIDVHIQLKIVLYRLGCSISLPPIAALFGIGDGGSISNYCKRVFSAILKHRRNLICWPNADERNLIDTETFHEMPHCIGYVDGTEVKLNEAPQDDPDAYLSRKQTHSMKVQIVADHKLRIRQIITGYPGSVHDARIYNQCQLALNSSSYFNQNQYLLADSAYKLTNTIITPFRANQRGDGDSNKKKEFNKRLSKYRVRVENTIGGLKERFESLKDLRVSIKDEESSEFVCDWIIVCGTLYNFILQQGDKNDYIRMEEVLQYEDLSNFSLALSGDSNGENKRLALMNYLFN